MKMLSWLICSMIALLLTLIFFSCQSSKTKSQTFTKPRVPDWHKNAVIYEVNLRHYTTESTFKSFEGEVDRLKKLGVDILWFMPIHEISKTKRKGELGSPYAVSDYKGVNPDYGSMEDFKSMLNKIHEAGMYCIIDWVPNHTGWDHPWIEEHPDWYTKDSAGNITDPIDYNTGKPWGWTDVADLNYDNPDMRKGMIDALSFWIEEVGIDGFRMDVAHGVPVDFWEACSDALYAIKPVYMLAEAEVPALRNTGAFVADYGWEMHHLLNDIAKSQGAVDIDGDAAKLVQGNVVESSEEEEEMEIKNALDIDYLLTKKDSQYSKGYAMHFTSNHDENSWAGTEFERMGEGHKAFAVFTATFDGMPLIYTGQEAAMDKQLEFFRKDTIEWGDYPYTEFYQKLFDLKHRNKALWNGEHGGELVKLLTDKDEFIYAFGRRKETETVVVIINLSDDKQSFTLNSGDFDGAYFNVMEEGDMALPEGEIQMELDAWDYIVLSDK